METHLSPYQAVEEAYDHLHELETIQYSFLLVQETLENKNKRLAAKERLTLSQMGINHEAIKGNLTVITNLIRGIEIMHEDKVALSPEQCQAVVEAPLAFKRSVTMLAALAKPKKPHFLEFLFSKRDRDESARALNILTSLSEIFTKSFCDKLQRYDDTFALRKGHEYEMQELTAAAGAGDARALLKLIKNSCTIH